MTNVLTQSLESFINHLKSQGRATATILAYGNDISQFHSFLQNTKEVNDLSTVTKEHIEEFKASLLGKNYTSKSVARKLNSIKTYFRYLESVNLVSSNPSQGVSHPKYVLSPPRILSKMEYRSLRDVCRHDSRMYAIIELFLQTGIRISELANLAVDDIKDNKVTIRAYESHGSRTIPLNKPAAQALEKWMASRPESDNQALFLTKTGRAFQVRNIRTAIDRYFKYADITKATVNDLRHTFIAHQLKAGTPLTLVSKLSGHKRLSTTEKYLEFIKEKSPSENLKLEEL
jgi:site-specific recombinase XerD